MVHNLYTITDGYRWRHNGLQKNCTPSAVRMQGQTIDDEAVDRFCNFWYRVTALLLFSE
jgi:hypothetical protein